MCLSLLGLTILCSPGSELVVPGQYAVFNSIPARLDGGIGASVEGGYGGTYNATAAQFSPSANGVLSSIDLSFFKFGPYAAGIILSLRASDSAGRPSTILTSGELIVTNDSLHPTLVTLMATNEVVLSAGLNYWVAVAPESYFSEVGWNLSLQSGMEAQTLAATPSPQDWRIFSAPGTGYGNGLPEFRVSAIPEPGIASLALIILILVLRAGVGSSLGGRGAAT